MNCSLYKSAFHNRYGRNKMIFSLLIFIFCTNILAIPYHNPNLVFACQKHTNCRWVNIVHYCKYYSNIHDAYRKYNKRFIFEGDIYISNIKSRSGMTTLTRFWSNGEVPFVMENYNLHAVRLVLHVMNIIEANTCIRFVPRTTEESYISLEKKENQCFSEVGKNPNSKSVVNLADPGCMEMNVIFHELFHALGIYHEQSRYDRDRYIKVLWENIDPNNILQFCLIDGAGANSYGLDYDINSIMHYNSHSFTKNGLPTILPKPGFRQGIFGKTQIPTPIDFEKVRRMYNCSSIAR